jgi:hypothetical protein
MPKVRKEKKKNWQMMGRNEEERKGTKGYTRRIEVLSLRGTWTESMLDNCPGSKDANAKGKNRKK